jgi:hypothetical protein
VLLVAALVVTCQDKPLPPEVERPHLAVLDGSDFSTVPCDPEEPCYHFFLLPPLVPSPDEFHGDFNAYLKPYVEVRTLLDESIWTCNEADGGVGVIAAVLTPGVEVDSVNEMYHVGFQTGQYDLTTGQEYRICVGAGSVELGFRDIRPVSSGAEVPRNPEQQPVLEFNNGSNLPVKFRIEKGALCGPDVPPDECGEATISLTDGGYIELGTGDRLDVPAQNELENDVTLIFQRCTGTSELPIDLRKFGPCLEVIADPPVTDPNLLNPGAILSICRHPFEVPLSEEQEDLVTLHRWGGADGDTVYALPHAYSLCHEMALAAPGGFMAFLKSPLRAVRDNVLAWVAPPLHADPPVVMHHGPAGTSGMFSKFQFALPAKMEIVPGTDDQFGLAGEPVPIPPAVHVTDMNDDDVEGATVHFTVVKPASGEVYPLTVSTDAYGIAEVDYWKLDVPNPNVLDAWGDGIADSREGYNGPLPIFDPFMTVDSGPPNDQLPVPLMTGKVTFTATACDPTAVVVELDGSIGIGEYADSTPFMANLSGGSAAEAMLYWTNDCENLYLAVRVERDEADKINTLRFDFDQDGDGVAESGDDVWFYDGVADLFEDRYLTERCASRKQSDCGELDPDPFHQGDGGFFNDGYYSVYELSHPLKTPGSAYDIQADFGQPVKLFLTLSLGKGAQGNTQWPGFRDYWSIAVVIP